MPNGLLSIVAKQLAEVGFNLVGRGVAVETGYALCDVL